MYSLNDSGFALTPYLIRGGRRRYATSWLGWTRPASSFPVAARNQKRPPLRVTFSGFFVEAAETERRL